MFLNVTQEKLFTNRSILLSSRSFPSVNGIPLTNSHLQETVHGLCMGADKIFQKGREGSQLSTGGMGLQPDFSGSKFCLMTFKPFEDIFTDHFGVQGRK
jgi:hypothetical protein